MSEVHETHVSWVVVDGDRAYKVKKPVRFPFLDHRAREQRLRACEAEVRLNRRLAPDIYLGVRGLVPVPGGVGLTDPDAPGVIDYAVEMRRFDTADTLESRIRRDAVDTAVARGIGAWLARFHAGAARAPGGAEPVKRALDDTFATLRNGGADVTALERAASAQLTRWWDELDRRAQAGLVRDGHGDLRAEHVLVTSDGFRAVDCIEFSDALRCVDVGADLAFLVMDLERLGRRDLALALEDGYRAAGGDPGPPQLVAFHGAARALVRAKVALLQGRPAGVHLELAGRLLWRARTPVVIALTGVAASGKSTLARALARHSGFAHLDSDVVRRELLRPPRYGPEQDRRTYQELVTRAAAELRKSGAVIVEGTFRRRVQRRRLTALAAGMGARLLVVECCAPAALLESRARARHDDVSEAGAAVVRAQLRDREPYDDLDARVHLTVRTDRPIGEVVCAVEDALDRPGQHLLRPRTRGSPRWRDSPAAGHSAQTTAPRGG